MRVIKQRWEALALLAGALGLVAIVSATALAGTGLKTRSATVTVDPSGSGSTTAGCKQGTKAVSGGFEAGTDPDDPLAPIFVRIESRRTGGRKWTAEGSTNFGTVPQELTSYAYCRDQRLKARLATTAVPEDEFGSVTATCKRGTKAFSGGWDAEFNPGGSSPFLRVTTSRRVGKRKWLVEGFNDGGGEGDLIAHVYCHAGQSLKTAKGEATLSGALEFDAAAARCAKRRRVISGGFEVEAEVEVDVAETLVMESRKLDRRSWRVAAQDNGGGPRTVVAYAYCEKKKD